MAREKARERCKTSEKRQQIDRDMMARKWVGLRSIKIEWAK